MAISRRRSSRGLRRRAPAAPAFPSSSPFLTIWCRQAGAGWGGMGAQKIAFYFTLCCSGGQCGVECGWGMGATGGADSSHSGTDIGLELTIHA